MAPPTVWHGRIRPSDNLTICRRSVANHVNTTQRERLTCDECLRILAGLDTFWCMDETCKFTNINLDGSPSIYQHIHRRSNECARTVKDVLQAAEQSVDSPTDNTIERPVGEAELYRQLHEDRKAKERDDPELRVHREDSAKQRSADLTEALKDFTERDAQELERIIGVLRLEFEESIVEGMDFHISLLDRAAEIAANARHVRHVL